MTMRISPEPATERRRWGRAAMGKNLNRRLKGRYLKGAECGLTSPNWGAAAVSRNARRRADAASPRSIGDP